MTPGWVIYVCLFLGLMTALLAGGLQVFSEFIMRALRKTQAPGGIAAMQHINQSIYRSNFFVNFVVLTPATIGFAIYSGMHLSGSAASLIIFAAVLFTATVFFVTAIGNVPMNERLKKLDPSSPEAEIYWSSFSRVWPRWNHIRTIGAMTTAGCYLLAAVKLAAL